MSDTTQRRLSAIVSADVVGYSRLMGADERGTPARLKGSFDSTISPLINTHGGRLVKLMGDGLLVEFQCRQRSGMGLGLSGFDGRIKQGRT